MISLHDAQYIIILLLYRYTNGTSDNVVQSMQERVHNACIYLYLQFEGCSAAAGKRFCECAKTMIGQYCVLAPLPSDATTVLANGLFTR